jgi:opacity protein-like surface antigen
VAPAGQSLCNEHAELRQWDIADRDRDRITVLGTITPSDLFGFSVSAAHGRDKYPNNTFGLRDNDNDIYSAGVTATPWERVALNLSYSWEHYTSTSASRQADPGPQFFDPTRNWETNGDEHAQSVLLALDVYKIFKKIDVKLGYDWNLSTQLYGYTTGIVLNPTLPEDTTITSSLTPAGTPCNGFTTCLPTVRNELHRASADFIYPFNDRVSIIFTYWHEQYRVVDWSLDAQAIPQVDLPGALLLGYQYLPYTAHTVWVHGTYRW